MVVQPCVVGKNNQNTRPLEFLLSDYKNVNNYQKNSRGRLRQKETKRTKRRIRRRKNKERKETEEGEETEKMEETEEKKRQKKKKKHVAIFTDFDAHMRKCL